MASMQRPLLHWKHPINEIDDCCLLWPFRQTPQTTHGDHPRNKCGDYCRTFVLIDQRLTHCRLQTRKMDVIILLNSSRLFDSFRQLLKHVRYSKLNYGFYERPWGSRVVRSGFTSWASNIMNRPRSHLKTTELAPEPRNIHFHDVLHNST